MLVIGICVNWFNLFWKSCQRLVSYMKICRSIRLVLLLELILWKSSERQNVCAKTYTLSTLSKIRESIKLK